MFRLLLALALSLPVGAAYGQSGTAGNAPPAAAPRTGPPHGWVFGTWTGGLFPAPDADSPGCLAGPTVIFTRDLVLRASVLEVAYRQRTVETAAVQPNGLEFRFTPPQPIATPLGARLPPDAGFGCAGGNPNVLQIERRSADEIVFPNCTDFPFPLKRCLSR